MKIRLTGTRDELTAAVAALGEVFTLREVSAFYPNHAPSVLGRVYTDAEPPHRPRASRTGRRP